MERMGKIHTLLEKGCQRGIYPGAVLLVARHGEIVFFSSIGHSTLIPSPAPMRRETIFDLASLTKPLATTLAIMKLVDEGKMALDQPLSRLLSGALPTDKGGLTPRLILNHCAGFIDWRPLYLEVERFRFDRRKDVLRKLLLDMDLAYRPGQGNIYSDIGFMFLEWIIERNGNLPLHLYFDEHFRLPLSLEKTFFDNRCLPSPFERDQFAATEQCPWRNEIMQGAVHDENAYSVGGYSGHAGLFGTALDVYAMLDLLRMHFMGDRDDFFNPETVRLFFTKQGIVAGSTWALGWDTPSPQGSSSGKYFSSNSVGHTGFTGTSVWMDLDLDVVVVLLTNRIHPTRKNEQIRGFRPELHDLIMKELGMS